ncbi:unnamed protein product [Arctogadus glacialis]
MKLSNVFCYKSIDEGLAAHLKCNEFIDKCQERITSSPFTCMHILSSTAISECRRAGNILPRLHGKRWKLKGLLRWGHQVQKEISLSLILFKTRSRSWK